MFIAYSRRQFYFAEDLTARLQAADVDAWFDVDRLEPGVDWNAEVDAALRRADAFVLVASRASLASPYVASEWDLADRLQTPVHVVFAESCALPGDLRVTSTHDLRTHFDRGARGLAAVLRGDRAPARTATRAAAFPMHLPFSVALFALALLSVVLALLTEGAILAWLVAVHDPAAALRNAASEKWIVLPALVVWCAETFLAVWMWWTFLERRFRAHAMLAYCGLSGIAGFFFLSYLSYYFTDAVQPGTPNFLLDRLGVLFGVVIGLNLVAVLLAWPSSDSFRRWLPTGEFLPGGSDELTSARGPAPPVSRISRRFRVHHDSSADADVASQLTASMTNYGHVLAENHADVDLIVVSDDTRRGWLNERLEAGPGTVVCVFATGVRLPPDLDLLHRRQWIDYRDRSATKLLLLSRFLATPDEARRPRTQIPERLDKPVTPWGVWLLFAVMVLVAGPAIGAGLAGLAELDRPPSSVSSPVLSRLAPLAVVAGGLLLWSAVRLTRRGITRRGFFLAFGLAFAALVVLGGSPMFVLNDSSQSAEIDRWISLGVLAAAFVLGAGSAWHWLPEARTRPRRHATLQAPHHPRFWLVYVVCSAVVWAGVVREWS